MKVDRDKLEREAQERVVRAVTAEINRRMEEAGRDEVDSGKGRAPVT